MNKISLETFAGLLVLILVTMLGFKAYSIYKQNNEFMNSKMNVYYAKFNNIEGIKEDSFVKIGGVNVGKVLNLSIQDDFSILVKIGVDNKFKLKRDSILGVASTGLFGLKYLSILPGFEETELKADEFFEFTKSSVNIEDLISKFATK
jgi:phospholipid/cholesterol/gamma-HCH transport system substrate-binding protein